MNDNEKLIEEDEPGEDGTAAARWALIAGACEETGREAAQALARHGVNLHLVDTNGGELTAFADEIENSFDVETECHVMNLREHLNAEVLALECEDADILIVCPGPVPMGGLMELDDDDWRKGFESRVTATISLVREFYETLLERGAGTIILDLSLPEPDLESDTILHSTAGGALSALVHVLEKKSADTGIGVLEIDAATAREVIDGLIGKTGGSPGPNT